MAADCLLWLLSAVLISVTSGIPSIVSDVQEVRAVSGETIVFRCAVQDLGTHSIQWYYMDHNLQISDNDVILVNDSRFAIIQPQGGAVNMKNLQISPLRHSDSGHYQCKVKDTSQSQISILTVIDAPVVPTQRPIVPVNFTDCCVNQGVKPECLPVCSPGTLNLNSFDINQCASDLTKLITCGTDGRNHVPCCRRRLVPTPCLVFCMNKLPNPLDQSLLVCLASSQPIISCYEEGQALLPPPPTHFTVSTMSSKEVHATWQPPAENAASVTGYRLFYKRVSDIPYSSTLVLDSGQIQYTLSDLEPNTLYSLYVISVNNRGSSLPTNLVQTKTNARNPLPPGLDRNTFEKCCENRGVSQRCRPVLCGDGPTDSGVTMADCFHDVNKVFRCMSGERNHTACCMQQGLDPACHSLCSGSVTGLQSHQVHCIQLLPQIASCFNEGAKNIPGSPTNVEVLDVKYNTARVRWSPPTENSNLVKKYIIRYWIAQQAVTNSIKQETVLSNVRTAALGSLDPGTTYTVEVLAEGESGSSIPSPSVIMITSRVPDNFESTPSPNPMPPYNETACCVDQGVTCLSLCSYRTDFSQVDTHTLRTCQPQLGRIMACGTDGRNHTNCCIERHVPKLCQPFCAFSKQMARDFNFETSHWHCAEHLGAITSCMTEGLLSLPSPPQDVTVRMTNQTITVHWQPPLKIPQGSTVSYRVSWMRADTHTWNDTDVRATSYIIHNLTPDTVYEVKVVSRNGQGSSLPAPTMETRTDSVALPINVTVPVDLTECCKQKNVSSVCLPACSGSATVDLAKCGHDLFSVIQCAADDRDHTPCCERSGLPDKCWSYCKGDPRADSLLELLCITFTPQMLTCFRQGYPELPSRPLNFHAVEVSPTSVKLAWEPPKTNPMDVTYRLFYFGAHDSSDYKNIDNVTSPHTLGQLKPIIPYTVFLIAVNSKGTSLPTPKITFVTIANESPMITIMQNPPDRYVKEGSVVVLMCHARGQPTPTVKWIRNGTENWNGTLSIGPLTPADTGRYTCVATNGQTPATENVFLNVQYAPTVQPDQEVVTIEANKFKTAQLQCEVKGFPETIVWQKDGVVVSANNSHGGRYMWRREMQEERGLIQAHFDISYVKTDDYGSYTCQVRNTFGTHEATIQLRDPTSPTLAPGVTLPPPVLNVTACCVSHGVRAKCLPICAFDIDLERLMSMNPEDQTDCLEDGDKILTCAADQRNHTKCCADSHIPDTCLPFCLGVVEQPLGDKSICLMYMEEIIDCMERGHDNLPSPPRNLRGRLINGFIQVWWEAPSINADKVQYYDLVYSSLDKVDSKNVTLDRFTLKYNLTGVHSHTTYGLSVEARNHHGTSHLSNRIQIQTYEMVPSKPYSLRGDYLDRGRVNLFWHIPDKYSGAVISYNVYYGIQHEHIHYEKVGTYSTANRYILENLRGNTSYSIYVTAVSSHFESKPSEIYNIMTGEVTVGVPGGQKVRNNTVVIPVVSVFVLLSICLIVGIFLYWYFRVRRAPHHRFKDTVSFENPGYASRGNANGEQREARAWISGLSSEAPLTPSSDLANQQPIIKGSIDGIQPGEVNATGTTGGATGLPDSSIMKEASDSNSDQGYATLSHARSNGTATGEPLASYATLDVGEVDIADGTVI